MPGVFISTNVSEYVYLVMLIWLISSCVYHIVYINVYYIYMVYQMQVIHIKAVE